MIRVNNSKIIGLTLSCVVLSFLILPSSIVADNQYNITIETGSQILEVKHYDPDLWNSVISSDFTPTKWFSGKSDQVGAQSKLTNTWKNKVSELSFQMFQDLFFEWYNISYIDVLKPNGYDWDYITLNYPQNYIISYVFNRYWEFRTEPFNEFPYNTVIELVVFLNLSQSKICLSDYNHFALVVNEDPAIQALNFSLPILGSDEFFWQYIIHCSPLPIAISQYLNDMIYALNCENVTIQGNEVTCHRIGKEPYIGKVTFNEAGRIETIEIIKEDSGELIYKITSFYPKFLLFTVLGVSSGVILMVVVVIIVKRTKARRIS